jgi:hypothetical protein
VKHGCWITPLASLALLALFTSGAIAATVADGCERLDASLALRDVEKVNGSGILLITVVAKCNLRRVVVTAYGDGGRRGLPHVAVLERGESESWRLAIPEGHGDMSIVASASEQLGRRHTLQVAVLRARVAGGDANGTLIVAVLGLLSTLVAIALGERFSRKRETRGQSVAWQTGLFDRYEAAYRRFLSTWGGVANADMLRATFAQLQSDALVPRDLVAMYKETLVLLANTDDPAERGRIAGELFDTAAAALGMPGEFGSS